MAAAPDVAELELDGASELDGPLELPALLVVDNEPFVEATPLFAGTGSGVLKLKSRTRAIAVVTRAIAPRRGNIVGLRAGIQEPI